MALGLVLVCAILEAAAKQSGGLIIGTAEIVAEISAFIVLLRILSKSGAVPRPYNSPLALGFIFLAIADAAYVARFYVFKLPADSITSILLTKLPYALGFASWILALLRTRLHERSSWSASTTIAGLLITTPIAARFVFLPFLVQAKATGLSPATVGEAANILLLFCLLNVAIQTYVKARDLAWSIFSVGLFALVLGDWAIRVETLLGSTPKFGVYEFLWGFGVILCSAVTLTSLSELNLTRSSERHSLLSAYKAVSASICLIPILFICLSQDSLLSSIKVIAIGTVATTIISAFLGHLLVGQIQILSSKLASFVSESYTQPDVHGTDSALREELREVYEKFLEAKIDQDRRKLSLEQAFAKQQALADLARQVAHDIRSPLAALNCAVQSTAELPEDDRVLIRTATSRIRDISNSLLQSYKSPQETVVASDPQSPELIDGTISTLLSEKRIQYRDTEGLQINFTRDEDAKWVFIKVDSNQFPRILSNLVDNAVEACAQRKSKNIKIETSIRDSQFELVVRDNGKGIPKDLLNRIGQRGFTSGKPQGNGLGLHHAVQQVKNWLGNLTVQSVENEGTEVRISLPVCEAPSWFKKSITLRPNSEVIVIDDDPSIHEIWRKRLGGTAIHATNIQVRNFSNPTTFLRYLAEDYKPNDGIQRDFLIDLEFLGSELNGLDLARRIPEGGTSTTTLITSHADERTLRDECASAGYGLLPKVLAGTIPVVLKK